MQQPLRTAMTTGEEAKTHHDIDSSLPPDTPEEDEGGSPVDQEFIDTFNFGRKCNLRKFHYNRKFVYFY